MGVNGQETEKKVHLKVVKGGETTVDTVFSASDLEDEDLHKKISELAGVSFTMTHGKDMEEMHAKHKHSYTHVTIDDDCEGSEGKKITKKVIDKDHEGHVKIVKVKKGEGDSEEMTVTVITDDEMHTAHDKGGQVHVFVDSDESGTVVVHNNVKVLKSIREGGELIEITVEIDEGEKEKMKEKSKETKQKKEKDRNKK